MSDRLPVTLCWHCDRTLDAARPANEGLRPEPGAVSLCIYCGAVAIFGDDLRLVKPTVAQLDELGDDDEFRRTYLRFIWARQYSMLEANLMGRDGNPDR